MNVHFSFKAAKNPTVEHEIHSQVEKLQRRLQVFRPDLIHLKGAVEHGADLEGIVVVLNLRLPTGQMAARGASMVAIMAVKTAFEELRQQLTQHKELLRDFRRIRREKGNRGREVPFEQTLASAHLSEEAAREVSAADITRYVNTSLPRLRLFVERELAFREIDGLAANAIAPEEVLDETVLAALSDKHERPEKLAIEPWLYGLALRAIDALAPTEGAEDNLVHLEKSARTPNVHTAESQMQFHQPDELLSEEDVVADRRATTPEEDCSSREWLALTESAMRDLPRPEREAFLLLAVEGFTVDEAAAITGRNHDDIRHSAAQARNRLRRMVPDARLHGEHRPHSAQRAS